MSPTIEVSYPNYLLPGSFASFRNMNLEESDAVILGEKGRIALKAHLHKGRYEVQRKDSSDWLRLNWVKFPKSESAEPENGVAYFDWVSTGASASDFGVVQVLQVNDGRIEIVQQIFFNTRGSRKAVAVLDPETNALTITGVHGWECCKDQLDVVRFRFEGGRFKRISYRTIPLS